MEYRPLAHERHDRYKVSVEEYVYFRQHGYLVVRGLVSTTQVALLRRGMDKAFLSRFSHEGEPLEGERLRERILAGFARMHMLHRSEPIFERFLLHPRILDVLEAILSPDVLCLQTMAFMNPPNYGGQGWHQDSSYIMTYPDTVTAASLAVDPMDRENGCLWVAPGSHCEPVYPDERGTFIHAVDVFADLESVRNTSRWDDENTLTRFVAKYPNLKPLVLEPGDVAFWHGHLFHRSYPNQTMDRWRRSFVCHYCDARSWVPWTHNSGDDPSEHILARGTTHQPYGLPKFGTPCAALEHARVDATR
jgi:ectoine hydroxylase-related dioxygenase (phytanoyl-CoA dioxygenase family)